MNNDIRRLAEVRRRADEIQHHVSMNDYENEYDRLRNALELCCRSLGMFADLEIQRLNGDIVTHDGLGYIEGKLGVAYDYVMNVYKDERFVERKTEQIMIRYD